jgi:hypothetical protein
VLQPKLGLRLRDRLGPEASQDLGTAFEEVHKQMLTTAAERFDSRLVSVEYNLRLEMTRIETGLHVAIAEGLATVRTDVGEVRADVLRWSFLFWIGQVAATVALVGIMLRFLGR